MGLDIRAYKELREVENPQFDEDGWLINEDTEWKPGASMAWSETHFPGRGKGIDANKVYAYKETYYFRAGSYIGYNVWREKLHKFKGDVAFQELINFADNEGVIGPVVSRKLYDDFKKYEEDAKEYSREVGSHWLTKYYEWTKAFEFASNNGAVEFC